MLERLADMRARLAAVEGDLAQATELLSRDATSADSKAASGSSAASGIQRLHPKPTKTAAKGHVAEILESALGSTTGNNTSATGSPNLPRRDDIPAPSSAPSSTTTTAQPSTAGITVVAAKPAERCSPRREAWADFGNGSVAVESIPATTSAPLPKTESTPIPQANKPLPQFGGEATAAAAQPVATIPRRRSDRPVPRPTVIQYVASNDILEEQVEAAMVPGTNNTDGSSDAAAVPETSAKEDNGQNIPPKISLQVRKEI